MPLLFYSLNNKLVTLLSPEVLAERLGNGWEFSLLSCYL